MTRTTTPAINDPLGIGLALDLARRVPQIPHQGSPLNEGDTRLLQAYLCTLGYFGDRRTIRSIDVVDGRPGPRTNGAIYQFLRDRNLDFMPMATADVLDAVRDHYRRTLNSNGTTPNPQWAALDRAFRADYPNASAARLRIHPAMRYPLQNALNDLRRQGVDVVTLDGQRTWEEQEDHVRFGRSNAPPGASFHPYGLAIDIVPRENAADTENPAWDRIHDTMQRHGFYSLLRAQGWDRPHFELPAATVDMMDWPRDARGWKNIPAATLPDSWERINRNAVARHTRTGARDDDELLSPLPTPRVAAHRDPSRMQG